MKKRMIGLLLALCLIVGLLPVTALAEETAPSEITSTLTITTGKADALVQWTPALSAGMTPAYAKTTAEGNIVTDGASATNYNLKVEWAANGKPTLTMKDATITNDNWGTNKLDTIVIGGTEEFVIVLSGTNTINGSPSNTNTNTHYKQCATGILAENTAALTIKGDSKADTLIINNKGGHCIYKYYDSLTIDRCTITIECFNKGGNAQHAIVLQYVSEGYEDKTNLTVTNAKLDITGANSYSNCAVLLTKSGPSILAVNVNTNTGDILFRNSEIRLYRNNSSSSTQDITALILSGSKGTITFDRCDVLIYTRHITMLYAPTVLNCKNVQNVSQNWGTQDYAMTPGTKITAGDMGKLTATHVCGTAADDFDCTTAEKCDMCGETVNAAQSAHKAEDDGDCTTAVVCANAGCKKVITAAQAAHKPAADDGDCTTAITCTNAGCKKITTEAKASHTSPADRKDCNTPANCTVCNKALAVGQHTGGTATCKDKAVCAVCKQAYGELAACVPAADDGDCTTAIKCTVCGKETTAAKEHKFTNDKDTSCDNEGCKYTRTITSNPNTGDISILLTAAVALSSAVGFAGVTVLRKKEN